MNELMNIISSPEFGEVRTVLRDGEPWFVAKDVCEVFGEKNRNRAMQCLDEDEKGYTQMTTPGGSQEVAIVNEPGLYALLFAMQPEKARGVTDEYIQERQKKLRSFKRWVTHDVLPSIRKQGYYSAIKDEDLIAIISKRRREDATYLLEGLADERDKLNAERYERLKVIWNTRRFDLTLEQVDEMIDEIWRGDAVGADRAKEHYRELYSSKLGLSHIYGRWKDPKKPKRRTFARERELIQHYEEVTLRKKLEEIRELGGCRIEDCENRIDFLERQDRIILKQYYEIQSLRAENDRLKNMVNAAVN